MFWSFPIYYHEKQYLMNHTYNLIIEFEFLPGLVVAILIFTNIFLFMFFAIKQIYFSYSKKDLSDIFYERAWLTSFAFFSHHKCLMYNIMMAA